MLPVWAPIDFDFDQSKIKQELLSNNVFNKSMIATTSYNLTGNSIWDPDGTLFNEDFFHKQKNIPHYISSNNGSRELIPGKYNTFKMLNLTYRPELGNSLLDSWEGDLSQNSRIPLWIKYQTPWTWRDDLQIIQTKNIINALPLEYVLTVRCILQEPPSIGVVHKDSGTKMNQAFYDAGYCSITLNICSGNANMWFLNTRNGEKHQIRENMYKSWHFDDSYLHCTSEVTDLRIQIRVFGKLRADYKNILNLDAAIF